MLNTKLPAHADVLGVSDLMAQLVDTQVAAPVASGLPFRFSSGVTHPDAERAYVCQRERAALHGQRWSERHAHALHQLQLAYVTTGLGASPGRTAWPLSVGTGKTESIVALAVAQSERAARGQRPISVLVCMELVRQLSDLYQAMVDAGVPKDFVAVYHRKTETDIDAQGLVAPVEIDDVSRYPIVLATYSMMLRSSENINRLNRYEGAERSLCLWDESLIKSKGHYIDLMEVNAAAKALEGCLTDFVVGPVDEDSRAACDFIRGRLDSLRDIFQKQIAGAPIEPVTFPSIEQEDETRFATGITSTLKGEAHLPLLEFLDHIQRPLRVVPFLDKGRRVGAIHYSTLVPPSLTRLIVLDASHNIRLLTSEHDTDIQVTTVDCAVKDFGDTTVRHLMVGSGRAALSQALPKLNSGVTREVIKEIASWPRDEAGLIFTFKLKPIEQRRGLRSHADLVKDAMTAAGIDVNATLPDGKPRFVFLTWGQHRGVNPYAYCTRALMVGVQRRLRLELAASMVGQRDDLVAPQAGIEDEVDRVESSEIFHNVIQAIGRGACRTTVDGKGGKMSVAIICNCEFAAEWWQLAMPGVQVQPWVPQYATRVRLSDDRVEAIKRALCALPASQDSVSTKTLKKLAHLDGLSSSAFKHCLADLKVTGWVRSDRSFIRCPFV